MADDPWSSMVSGTPDAEAFHHAPAAYAVSAGDSLVVVDRSTGEMHQLDAAAAAIWREVDGRATASQIVERVAAGHGIGPDDIAAGVHAGLRGLLDSGLLRGGVEHVPPAPAPLSKPSSPAPAPETPIANPTSVSATAVAARCLQLDLAAVEVDTALRSEDIEPILLKGSSLAHWLYGGYGERQYGDVDLLVPPESVAHAERVLESRKFSRRHVSLPQTVPFHATTWYRESDRVTVDLHDRIWGCGVAPARLWDVLQRHRVPLDLLGVPVDVPGVPVRLVHLCLHAAQSAGGRRKKLEDLRRAVDLATRDDWEAARRLAGELDATEAMGAGLRLFDEGRTMADDLDLPVPGTLGVVLSAAGANQATISVLHLFAARSLPEALRFVWGRLFPPPAFIRQWATFPTNTPSGLARAYLVRWRSIVVRGFRAVPALARAWRSTRRSRD